MKVPQPKLSHSFMSSPVGQLKLVATDDHLLAVLWVPDRPRRVVLEDSQLIESHPVLTNTTQQLNEYFAESRKEFDLPLRLQGTSFQSDVWSALLHIQNGDTWSYQQLAKFVGRPTASRAVGAAVGRNPISIIVPCHRVVGSRGALTGFAGGVAAKSTLLELEQIRAQ